MNEAWLCDIGDYGKYGLLRFLAEKTNLSLGVVWYRTSQALKKQPKQTFTYLETAQPWLRDCDPDLFDFLRALHNQQKATFETICDALPRGTHFFPDDVPLGDRGAWLKRAIEKMRDQRLIFLDPDNGFWLREDSEKAQRSTKHVFCEEIARVRNEGKSVVFYHHHDRSLGKFDPQISRITGQIRDKIGAEAHWLRSHRVQARAYFVVPTHQDGGLLTSALDEFRQTRWVVRHHFSLEGSRA